METFDSLPLVAVVNQSYILMHGGISPSFKSIEAVNALNRFTEIPVEGLICDIVWSDPMEDDEAVKKDFTDNSERACSYKYGLEPVKKILDDNDYTLLIRAHQVQVQGYRMHYWETPQVLPSVITLFSAPNYCDVYKNKGAVIKLEVTYHNALICDKGRELQHKELRGSGSSIPFASRNESVLVLYSLPR